MAGTSVAMGNGGRLGYAGAATRGDAENVGRTLTELGFYKKPAMFLLLSRGAGGASISIPFKADETLRSTQQSMMSKNSAFAGLPISQTVLPWDDPAVLASIKAIGPGLASALGGPPLTIRLLNGDGELRKEVRIDAAELVVGARDKIWYETPATLQDAKALGQALQACGFFKDHGARVSLSKTAGATVVSFYVRDGAWDDPRVVLGFQGIGRKIAPAVGGPPLKVQLMDTRFESKKELAIE
jgi:hypothetical protein